MTQPLDPLLRRVTSQISQTVLFDLAMRGNIKGIEEAGARLEHLDAQFVPFARELYQLAKGFQERRIREFIQNYMERNE